MFLFDDEVSGYLKGIDVKAIHLITLIIQLNDEPVGEKRSEMCERKSGILQELIGELPNLKCVFSPYLKFDRWK
jgi:hypothetical protein